MPATPQPVVTEGSFLTLHYRLSTADGKDIVSTFGDSPATLQMGAGQLAPFLEQCLLGMVEGAHQIFELTPEQAFGPRNADLLQRVSLATLRENSAAETDYCVGIWLISRRLVAEVSLACCFSLKNRTRCSISITLWPDNT